MVTYELYSFVMSLLIITVECFCSFIIFNTVFTRKRKKNKLLEKNIEIILLVVLLFIATKLPITFLLKSLLTVTSYFIVNQVFYSDSKIKKICVDILMYLLILLIDIASSELINLVLAIPIKPLLQIPLYFLLFATFAKNFLFLTIVFIKKFIDYKRNKTQHIMTKYQIFVYILQGTITMVSILALIQLTYFIKARPTIVVIATIGLLFLCNIVFGLLEKNNRYEKEKIESALYRQQVDLGIINTNALVSSFEAQSTYLHDHKKSLRAIYQLIDSKEYEVAKSVISSNIGNLYTSIYRFKTNHAVIDAILNQKYIEAKKAGIVLDIRAEDLEEVDIKEHYLITVLSNVIDNAIEATQQVNSGKNIIVKLVIEEGVFIFSVINPVCRNVKIVNNLIKTSKKDKLIHGMGLKNVAFALEQCGGSYELGSYNQKFQFTALIVL